MYIGPIAQVVAALSNLVAQQSAGHSGASTTITDGQEISLVIPASMPSYSERLDPQLVALSIEADRWPDWAGYDVGSPNAYTTQLLANLQSMIGMPPAIRVGGETTLLLWSVTKLSIRSRLRRQNSRQSFAACRTGGVSAQHAEFSLPGGQTDLGRSRLVCAVAKLRQPYSLHLGSQSQVYGHR